MLEIKSQFYIDINSIDFTLKYLSLTIINCFKFYFKKPQ